MAAQPEEAGGWRDIGAYLKSAGFRFAALFAVLFLAAILGFVGAGGLGQLLYFELSLFHYAQASTVIMAMLLLSITVDWSSAALRRSMR